MGFSANRQNLLDDLTELLESEQAFISDGAILRNVVIEAALSMDPRLLKLLIQSEEIKAHFFVEVAGTLIFDKVKFRDFISSKTFLPDSYTAFKNRISLVDEHGNYLSQSRNVVLTWPYKDCVLEGGMTKEDRGRKEVFWNTMLSPDDITRLLEPKVLTGWERWSAAPRKNGGGGAVACQPIGEVRNDDNLLIKGNNLLALHSLKPRYAGKVKLIYIDPPYNTGNDGFLYNDKFSHASWLTFMKNRLEVARDFLRDDGLIVIHIDDNEQAYLKVLMDDLFGRDNFVGDLIRKTKSTTNDAKTGFNIQHENTLIYAKDKSKILLIGQKKTFDNYKNPDNDLNGAWVSADPSARSGDYYFPIENPYTGKIDYPPENSHWRFSERRLQDYIDSGKIVFRKEHRENQRGFIFKRYRSEIKSEYNLLGSLEGADNRYMNQKATKERNKLFGEVDFAYPKPESFAELIIRASTESGDIVLDFFAGSGTAAAVAHKMGRQWIAVEQMDYIRELTKTRMKKVIEGEQGGISEKVGWGGGGLFVYAELAASNSVFADRIGAANKISTLQSIKADMQQTGFLRYDMDMDAFGEDEFANLSLDDAKHVLTDCLDANHLYVNLNSLGDKHFSISDEDAAINRTFYGVLE